MSGIYKGLLTAALIGLLLLLAQRWGKRHSGLVTGAPTVSGPALVWMGAEHGPAFAAHAAAGAVFGSIACAAFASAYVRAGGRCGPVAALAVATLAVLAGLLPAAWWTPELGTGILLSALMVVALRARTPSPSAMSGASAGASAGAWVGRGTGGSAASTWLTAAVAGSASAAVSIGASGMGPFACGLIASLPLIAAAVGVRLHRQQGISVASRFLCGYHDGLIGRIAFSGVFGGVVLILPLPAALALALLASGAVFAACPRLAALADACRVPGRGAVGPMHGRVLRGSGRCAVASLVAVLVALLAGGCDSDERPAVVRTRAPVQATAATVVAAAAVVTPRLATVGRATAAQYAWAAAHMEAYTVLVVIDRAASPQQAVAQFIADYEASDCHPEPEVFVTASDPMVAKRAAQALVNAGARHVFVLESVDAAASGERQPLAQHF